FPHDIAARARSGCVGFPFHGGRRGPRQAGSADPATLPCRAPGVRHRRARDAEMRRIPATTLVLLGWGTTVRPWRAEPTPAERPLILAHYMPWFVAKPASRNR